MCLNICVGAWNALIFDLLYFDMCLNELLIDITQKFGMFVMVVERWCMMEGTIGGLVGHRPCHGMALMLAWHRRWSANMPKPWF